MQWLGERQKQVMRQMIQKWKEEKEKEQREKDEEKEQRVGDKDRDISSILRMSFSLLSSSAV